MVLPMLAGINVPADSQNNIPIQLGQASKPEEFHLFVTFMFEELCQIQSIYMTTF